MQLGKKYVHGSYGPDTFDCAGLTWFIYAELFEINIHGDGIGMSTTTKQMTSSIGTLNTIDEEKNKEAFINELNAGDILFFHRQSLKDSYPKDDNYYPGHCGIYLGNNTFIHGPRKEGKIVIDKLHTENYWAKVLVGSKTIIANKNDN